MRKSGQIFVASFFILAGLNHFRDPAFYFELIPPVFSFPKEINLVSGSLEILGGTGYLYERTRKKAAFLLITLLVLFVPSHIHFIQIGSCVEKSLCVPPWMSWLRLLIIHPLIIWIIYFFARESNNRITNA
jgi:uncharacterized membrane protein